MKNSFFNRLRSRAQRLNSWVCVGLDIDPKRIPVCLKEKPNAQEAFGIAIIEATHDVAMCYKANSAFFEAEGVKGHKALEAIVAEARRNEVPMILDAKRADIGNTSKQYATACFDRLKADAITVNPYLGQDGLQPFLDYEDKGIFVLGLTSNPGAADFEKLLCDGMPLFEHVAKKVASWNDHGNCGLVVGATQPEELERMRGLVSELPFLVPGIGAQGGALDPVVKHGCTSKGVPPVINSSRGILYASSGEDFAQAATKAAEQLRDRIRTATDK